MDSEHDQTDPVDRDAEYYREEYNTARAALQACYAALRYADDNLEHGVGHRPGGSDAVRVAEAADVLREILAVPGDHPDELRGVLAVLEGGVDR